MNFSHPMSSFLSRHNQPLCLDAVGGIERNQVDTIG
jgi:hypothetical protein